MDQTYGGPATQGNGRRPPPPLQTPAAQGVTLYCDGQRQLVAELHGTINVLEERLATIIDSEPTGTGQAAIEKEPYHLVDKVRANNDLIGHATQRLQSLLQRLQL